MGTPTPSASNGGSEEHAEDHAEGDVTERRPEDNPQDHTAASCQSLVHLASR
jgi:hypothetical protein